MAVQVIFWLLVAQPFILFAGCAYGDRKHYGKWFWQKEKSGVNSGAKFG